MVYGTYNYNIVTGAFVNQRSHHWGASLCRYVQNISSAIVNLLLSMTHWESTQNLKKKTTIHPPILEYHLVGGWPTPMVNILLIYG